MAEEAVFPKPTRPQFDGASASLVPLPRAHSSSKEGDRRVRSVIATDAAQELSGSTQLSAAFRDERASTDTGHARLGR